MKLAFLRWLIGRQRLPLTTVTNTRVKNLGEHFIPSRNRDGVVALELDIAANLAKDGSGLCLWNMDRTHSEGLGENEHGLRSGRRIRARSRSFK